MQPSTKLTSNFPPKLPSQGDQNLVVMLPSKDRNFPRRYTSLLPCTPPSLRFPSCYPLPLPTLHPCFQPTLPPDGRAGTAWEPAKIFFLPKNCKWNASYCTHTHTHTLHARKHTPHARIPPARARTRTHTTHTHTHTHHDIFCVSVCLTP